MGKNFLRLDLEDGFGMESDKEIWLYALMDQNGDFITPFSEYKPGKEDYEKYKKE